MPERSLDFSLVGFVNKRLIPVLLKESGIENIKMPVRELSAKDRRKIVNILTDWSFKIRGTKSWPSAQVTAGGVDTDQIDPFTMESALVKGLYFCGEIVDIDGACGGFNLQWAWSSGYVAGSSAASR
jgi:predicted Rossmann fold flavoprotein